MPPAAMIMRKLYAIGDQAERDAAERYSPEAEAANESVPSAAAGDPPLAGDAHPSAGVAALPEDVYSLASSEHGAGVSAVDLDGSADSGQGMRVVAAADADGEPARHPGGELILLSANVWLLLYADGHVRIRIIYVPCTDLQAGSPMTQPRSRAAAAASALASCRLRPPRTPFCRWP